MYILHYSVHTILNKKLKLAVVYKPDQVLQPVDELIEQIENLDLDKNISQFVAVCGDLNMPDANWRNPDLNSQCAKVLRIRRLQQLGFHQIVNEATRITNHSANILDIILTNQSENFQNITVEDGIGDHNAILADITVKHKIQRSPKRKIYLYNKANSESLKKDLRNFLGDFTQIANSCNDINKVFEHFKSSVDSFAEKNVPAKLVKDSREPPWYTRQIRNLLKRTRRQHSIYKKTGSTAARSEERRVGKE